MRFFTYLYARFWHKFLYDIGVVPTKEPFQKLFNQGMILGENNEKMSKSKGNVVNPDDIVKAMVRIHFVYMKCLWDHLMHRLLGQTNGLDGSRRFLDRIWRLFVEDNGPLNSKIQDT